MKFMKLGSKPNTFYTVEAVRSISSEVSSDLLIQVHENRYLLHKFPLLSKCSLLQKLSAESSPNQSQPNHIHLPDFPGGPDTFELCVKFCYGITITLSAYNIVPARCAAEYLQMTEETEKGNLIQKLEVFFTSCILHGWKDTIMTLQSTKLFQVWSEDLGITSRCIESLATKVLSQPGKVSLSRSGSRRGGREDDGLLTQNDCNGGGRRCREGEWTWWGEDLTELGIDLYWRTMIAIKSGGKVPSSLIGEALQIYASKWFHNIKGKVITDSNSGKQYRLVLESVVSLLPSEKGAVPCSFLIKLLKAANRLGGCASSKIELARRVAVQLDEASVKDLLIPTVQERSSTTKYDVDIVISVLQQYGVMVQGQGQSSSPPRRNGGSRFQRTRRRSRSTEDIDLVFEEGRRSSSSSGSKIKVVRLVDGYLKEIASDPNLPLLKIIQIAESVPDFARVDHDDLYRAIDIYLKAHPDLSKSERKRLCRILDCKRLSMEMCMHAAQNEFLPSRVVIQVLFFDHARSAKQGGVEKAVLRDHHLHPNVKALNLDREAKKVPPPEEDALSTSRKTTTNAPTSPQAAAAPKLSRTRTTTCSSRINNHAAIDEQKKFPSKAAPPPTLKMRLAEDEEEDSGDDPDGILEAGSATKLRTFCSMPRRAPKKMLHRLLSINRNNTTEKALMKKRGTVC